MFLTLWCILVAIASLYIFGLPVATVLADKGQDRRTIWIVSPFLGLSVIILVLQNLIYLDVWISRSALLLWVSGGLLWLWLAITGRWRLTLSAIPHGLILAAMAVYFVQGIGLLLIGAQYYVARAWIDQFNYTAYAQFLTDYPFSLTYDGVVNQPTLIKAISIKFDRIGVSIYQGFLALSTFTDPKTVFEPAILLTPLLIVIAVHQLGYRLGLTRNYAAFSAVSAGVLPAVTMVHVETFFSQALGIPFLLLWPVVVSDLIEGPSRKRLLTASLILAAGTSIYTEYYLIFLGVAALAFAFSVLGHRERLVRSVLTFLLLISIALALNLGFLRGIYEITGRVSWTNILINIYPWAFTIEGVGRLWLGDTALALQPIRWLWVVYGGLSIGLVLFAYFGLAMILRKRRDGLALSILLMAAIPIVIRIWGGQYPYQFYKLLLSTSPLLLIGIAAATYEIHVVWSQTRFLKGLIWVGKIALLLFLCVGTVGTTLVSGVFPVGGRSILASRLLSSGARQVQDKLSTLRGQNILIVSSDNYINAWLAYFARHNHVWVSNSFFSDINIEGIQQFRELPDDIFLLTYSMDSGLYDRSVQPIWSAESYQLWKVAGKNWTVLLDVKNANGVEEWGEERGFWLGEGETEADLVSSKPGRAELTAEFTPGPSLPDTSDRHITILAGNAYSVTTMILREGKQTFSIPVAAGFNRIILRALDKATLKELPNGDARALILGVRGLSIRLE